MSFPPIAIVGQACLLPGASTPDELWQLTSAGGSALEPAPAGRWGIDRALMLPAPGQRAGERTPDRAVSDVGGYVSGFDDRFDARGFALAPDAIAALDPLFQWLLHVGREALRDAAFPGTLDRAGVVVGNLSYPSRSLSRFAERVWLGATAMRLDVPQVAPSNRFMSGLPAHLLARALGLGGGAFALDAACASSLYAIKLACDTLHDGRADLMLAGAVNAADDLFIHAGFTALGALSPSGRSRPFHAEADGLVPGEGAALVALRRLPDAERDGDRILGVIRGIGLSNDGRGRGLLVPSQEGQVRALRAAYRGSGVAPSEVSLVECHATGTTVGDGVEIRTLAEVFARRGEPLPIGSLKANLGHLITVAGAAGLIKVLGALRHRLLPPTPGIDRLTPALDGTPLRVLQALEPWRAAGPLCAAVSAFGFGGNNAHLIVEEAPPRRTRASRASRAMAPAPPRIAIVSIGARVADGDGCADFAEALFTGRSLVADGAGRASQVALSLGGLRFPPRDLEETLPQQLLVLAAAGEALAGVAALPNEGTSVLIGLQCDAEIARHGARWRMAGWAQTLEAPEGWLAAARDGIVPLLGAAGVLGAMPNIPANRLNSQFDLGGPSLAVSAEELSGIRALEIARRGLEHGEIDAALVGAVDLCAEPVHLAAAAQVLPAHRHTGGDAAVVMVLKRLTDARRDGDPVLALLGDAPPEAMTDPSALQFGDRPGAVTLEPRFGHAHAASGLLHVAAAALCCQFRARPAPIGSGDIVPWTADGPRAAVVTTLALGDQRATVWLQEDASGGPGGAPDRAGILGAVRSGARRARPPLLSFPAHRSAPLLPALDRACAPQPMPAAPWLPPILDSLPDSGPRSGPGESPLALVIAGQAAQRRRMAAVHQEFLESQGALHLQFLATRHQAVTFALGRGLVPPAAPSPVPVRAPAGPTGPQFSRADLETHASGRISRIFGPGFAEQDRHALQVRMPEPPLLLADRVTGLRAQPGSLGLGTVWTETDVHTGSWYLNRGFTPAGIMIEAGQADLFLISYLGIDEHNQGQRAYRLLGCELTYHGGLPRPGDTLRYEITIDGHARQDDVRLFFFHYDCTVASGARARPALTVRHGQAGFFSRADLDASAGVLWSAEQQEIRAGARLDPPSAPCPRRALTPRSVRAFAAGDLHACFGTGFEGARTHVRSPAIQADHMLLIDSIADLDPSGGPWGRGYLKAVTAIRPDHWFFAGHFKNDPCMPGTLMFEGCLQAMAVYLAALGYTLERDGWRFEPVPDETYRLQCRGQVLPSSKELVCELFVEEVHDGDTPTLYADLLGTVDGLKAFHARRVGLRLVADWPLSDRHELSAPRAEPDVVEVNGFRFDHRSLLACAWGRPSEAFGPMYAPFDGTRRVARLPGPPYHFMSRVVKVDGALGICQPGASIEIEHDVPAHAWYFDENGHPTMPFCVLLETVLQPCGWLASYVGSALVGDEDLSFRNLDGVGRVLAEVPPGPATLRTVTRLTNVSRAGGMILESFQVRCFLGDTPVYELETSFGFFPRAALEDQVGLPTTPAQRQALDAAGALVVDLTTRPARYFEGPARLPEPMLLMLDRVTAFDARGGRAGLGSARADKDVDPAEWFFKAHFFQDPVQPGSLGLEAMLQLLQFTMLELGMADEAPGARFEPIAIGRETTWKYRGQVLPGSRVVTTTLELTERGNDDRGPFAIADASLFVDGKRIYQATGLGMRLVPGAGGGEGRRVLTPATLLPAVTSFWRRWFGASAPPVEDLYRGLIGRFVRHLHVADPEALLAAGGKGVVFLANHQTSVESTLFAVVGSALVGTPMMVLARVENRHHWLELLMQLTFRYPGLRNPDMPRSFDRSDPASLPGIIAKLGSEMRATGRSLLVHVEGTRALSCRRPVQRMSGTFIDMALELGRPIVPVRFSGGLPVAPLDRRTDLPVDLGRQDVRVGLPLWPGHLLGLDYRERMSRVIEAMNALGPPHEVEQPLPDAPSPFTEEAVRAWASATGVSFGHAAILRILEHLPEPSPAIADLVAAARGGPLRLPPTPEGRWLAELAARLLGPPG